ncbi:hypothetical protein BCR42DRAFT_425153 [Absidia repens]|uniref:DUF1279 domain-containing protein n=1 Tax=Absidia repens TaxID=90262 RepID=A0A1X2I3D2_9FUNG|nr:hypothetical protein BCR42DRAFT_425153 [Absidia repens]
MSQRLSILSKSLVRQPFYRIQTSIRPSTRFSGSPLKQQGLWRRHYTTNDVTSKTALPGQQTVKPAAEGKLKQLARTYGPSGVIVYLAIGMVDLGFTVAAIQMMGTDKVKMVEKTVLDKYNQIKERYGFEPTAVQDNSDKDTPSTIESEDDDGKPSLTSIFLLAYGIHKTLMLPVRLAITTAITPAVVRKIHTWGWAKYAPRLFGSASASAKTITKSP